MKEHLKGGSRRWTSVATIVWTLLLFIYESPNVIYLTHKTGLLESPVRSRLGAYPELKDPWYPWVDFLFRGQTEANVGKNSIMFRKASLINPWNSGEPIIFSNAGVNLKKGSDGYKRLVSKEVVLSWGEVWELQKLGSQKTSMIYIPRYDLYVSIPPTADLTVIKSIRPG